MTIYSIETIHIKPFFYHDTGEKRYRVVINDGMDTFPMTDVRQLKRLLFFYRSPCWNVTNITLADNDPHDLTPFQPNFRPGQKRWLKQELGL